MEGLLSVAPLVWDRFSWWVEVALEQKLGQIKRK